MTSKRSKKIKYYASDDVLGEFYKALASGDPSNILRRVHIPRSDVFYVREAYHNHSGVWETLDRIERCMYLEGMLSRRDVLDPDRERDWEKDYVPTRPEKQEDS
jgi:hypothetical protein